MYLYAIDYDNYGIVIADGDVDGNDVTETDDSYDYYINTSDDDDDNADSDEILTVECDYSVKINSSDKWLNNSVLILWYLLSSNWYFLIILQLIIDVSTLDNDHDADAADDDYEDLSRDHVAINVDIWKCNYYW